MRIGRFIQRLVLGIAISIALSAASILPLHSNAAIYRTALFTGDPITGLDGYQFLYSTPPTLSSTGSAAFAAYFTENGTFTSANKAIIRMDQNYESTLVARIGNDATGIEGDVYLSDVDDYPLAATGGLTVFSADLAGEGVTTSNYRSVWSKKPSGDLQLIARDGNPAPGVPGHHFYQINVGTFNQVGQMILYGSASTAGPEASGNGYWSVTDAGVEKLAFDGDHAPGMPADVSYSSFAPPSLNDSGQLVYVANLKNTTSSFIGYAVYKGTLSTGVTRLTGTGDHPPGTETGVTFNNFSQVPRINSAGHIAFKGGFAGGPSAASTGIFSDRGGNGLELVLRRNTLIPAASGDVRFFGINQEIIINDRDQIAFQSILSGTGISSSNDTAVFRETSGGQLQLMMQEGAAAPGTTVQFDNLPDSPSLNRWGRMVISAKLKGTGVTTANDMGIWAEGLDGQLQLIAREGGLFDVDDGPATDLRTISSLYFPWRTGNGDGFSGGSDNQNHILFHAYFTDGSAGVFAATLVPNHVAGDFNNDGIVDTGDYLVWRKAAGQVNVEPYSGADGNGSGAIDDADFQLWKSHYGMTQTGSGVSVNNVPEPACLLIALVAMYLPVAGLARSRSRESSWRDSF